MTRYVTHLQGNVRPYTDIGHMMISKWPKMNLTFLLHLLAISMPTENLFSVFTMITSNMPNNCRRWLEVVQHDKDEL